MPDDLTPPAPPTKTSIAPVRAKNFQQKPAETNVKETIEAILVAFILAFIFRCFVVEAFVIPTGSMAPTLLGAHSHFQCDTCSYPFDVEFRQHDDRDDVEIPDHVPSMKVNGKWVPAEYAFVHCPNCGQKLPSQINPAVAYGDRILVLKYMYMVQKPQRWDVIVFKSPNEHAKEYSVSYIKRLIALPDETLLILDGDIYIQPKGQKEFHIARKTPAAQSALWRLVFDNDYRPKTSVGESSLLKQVIQPWKQTDGSAPWATTAANGREFTFASDNASGTLSFDANELHNKQRHHGITDWLGYDQPVLAQSFQNSKSLWLGRFPVSDLKLKFFYEKSKGDGPLQLSMSKLDDIFVANILKDEVRLVRKSKSSSKIIWEKTAPVKLAIDRPMPVEMVNVDYRVTVRVDGNDILTTTDEEYHPNIDDIQKRQSSFFSNWPVESKIGQATATLTPPTVSVSASNQTCRLSHISLFRDNYYTPRDQGNNDALRATPYAGQFQLQDKQYFVLGDNSPGSADSRYWRDGVDLPDENIKSPPGIVPEAFLTGRAFFVYWPAGYRPTEGAPAILPNIADMRFIK